MSKNGSSINIHVDKDPDTVNKLNQVSSKFISEDNLSENIMSYLIDYL